MGLREIDLNFWYMGQHCNFCRDDVFLTYKTYKELCQRRLNEDKASDFLEYYV